MDPALSESEKKMYRFYLSWDANKDSESGADIFEKKNNLIDHGVLKYGKLSGAYCHEYRAHMSELF